MPQTAKLFMNGRSQAVRLPSEFRFAGSEVHIRQDPGTGDVILSRKAGDWSDFLKLLKQVGPAEEEFMQHVCDPATMPEDIF